MGNPSGDSTISRLPAAQALTGAEVFPIDQIQSGTLQTVKTTLASIATQAFGTPGNQNFSLLSNGPFSIPTFQQITAPIVNYNLGATGSTTETQAAKNKERISVLDFGAVGDGVTDNTTALANARTYLAANAQRCRLVFPPGNYAYATSPNWAIQDAEIVGEGQVFLTYTGTGNAVIIDSGSLISNNTYNLKMGRFIVNCPSTALNAVFVRGVHHSRLGFDVRGAGSASAGLYVQFAVCIHFEDYTCSVNENAWFGGAKPAFGMNLDIRNSGEDTSYCLFTNAIIEGTNLGIQLLNTLGNIFIGGTSEGNTTYGVFASSGSLIDKFWSMDFESNTTADVYCQGSGLELHGCDTTNRVNFGTTSKNCLLDGGNHQNLETDVGGLYNTFTNARYNRLGSGTFVNSGTSSIIWNVRDYSSGVLFQNPTPIPAIGRTDGIAAAAGNIGEIIQSSIPSGSAVSLTTAVAATVTSISLTAGDWDIWGNVLFTSGASTVLSLIEGSISTTAATLADPFFASAGVSPSVTTLCGSPVPSITLNVSSTTTVYLIALASFTTSTCKAYGRIIARRRE